MITIIIKEKHDIQDQPYQAVQVITETAEYTHYVYASYVSCMSILKQVPALKLLEVGKE